MYRQYEDPHRLEEELERVRSEFEREQETKDPDDIDWAYWDERIHDLEERINFAWQDDEYDSNYATENGYYDDDIYGDTSVEGTPVKAGKLYDLIKKALGLFDKLVDKLGDMGEVGDTQGKDFSLDFLMSNAEDAKNLGDDSSKWPDDSTVRVKVKFVSGEDGVSDTIDVLMKVRNQSDSAGFAKKGLVVTYSDPSNKKQCTDELVKAIADVIEEVASAKLFPNLSTLDASSLSIIKCVPVNSNTSVRMTLKKVVANDELDIELVAINSPFDAKRTNTVIDQIVDNPDFVESLPMNEPASYDVNPEDLSFLACEDSECCDLSCSIFKILQVLYKLYFDSMSITWNAKGPNYQTIVTLADTYMWTTKGLIDQLSIEHFKLYNYAPHPTCFVECDSDCNFTNTSSVQILQNDISCVIDIIDLYYCNFEGLLQQCLIDAKDKFSTELNYTLARFSE